MTSTWQKEKNNSDSKSPTCHSVPSFCHSKFPPCHSEPLGEESIKRDSSVFAKLQNDKKALVTSPFKPLPSRIKKIPQKRDISLTLNMTKWNPQMKNGKWGDWGIMEV